MPQYGELVKRISMTKVIQGNVQCSMGCMYATGPVEKCLCSCKGEMHALMIERPKAVKCSPAVEKRCKGGEEGGECACACGGINHGLYTHIENFDNIKINGYI